MPGLKQTLRDIWAAFPEQERTLIHASPLTDRQTGLPQARTIRSVFPMILPRHSTTHGETMLVKSPDQIEAAQISESAADELRARLLGAGDVLARTAEMFQHLAEIAVAAGVDLPRESDEAFYKLAFNAAALHRDLGEVDDVVLTDLLQRQYGGTGRPISLYQEIAPLLDEPRARQRWESIITTEWEARAPRYTDADGCAAGRDTAFRLLADALDGPRTATLSVRADWAALEAEAHTWPLRTDAEPRRPVLSTGPIKLPLPPLPLDRTVWERVGSLIKRGSSGRELRAAGETADSVMAEAAARACDYLGLSVDNFRATLVLGLLGADLLVVDAPTEVARGYGEGAYAFGRTISRSYAVARDRLHKLQGGGPRRRGDDEEREKSWLADQALANALQLLLDGAADDLVRAVWVNMHSREVLGRAELSVAEAITVVRGRATHEAKEYCEQVTKSKADDRRFRDQEARILAVLPLVAELLGSEVVTAIATSPVGPLPPDLRAALRVANRRAHAADPDHVRVHAGHIRNWYMRSFGNGS